MKNWTPNNTKENCICMKIEHDTCRRHGVILICLLLTIIIIITFWGIQHYDFVFDDAVYVTNNAHVTKGLTADNILWALTTTDAGFWHPLTWLSLLIDYELYGLNAGGYHWVNLLFHIGSTILLFLALNRMTGSLYCSGFVAALFAIHPLHVESVVWIAERKDVLSTFFWMLTMWLYVYYVNRPGVWRYCIVLCAFILGLLSKPMLVTLPFVLLMFDYWPLNRFGLSSNKKQAVSLVLEKAPLVVVSIIMIVVTFYTEQKAGVVLSFELVPPELRLMNVVVSYVEYIKKMFWPQDMAVFYPYFTTLPIGKVLLSGLVLIVISLFAVRQWKERPYLAVGWLWYIGTLVPVIGIIQIGSHAMADRYTYVPLIGLFIMMAWGTTEMMKHWSFNKYLIPVGAIAVIFILMTCSRIQLQVWKNSITLFQHAINVTTKNYLAHNNLGEALASKGEYEAAVYHYREAIKIRPNYALAHTNLGVILVLHSNFDEGIKHFHESLKIEPNYSRAQLYLADTLLRKGECDESIALYYKILQIEQDNPDLYNNLGVALACRGKINEAIHCFESAIKIKPDYAEARNNLKIINSSKKQAK